MASAVNETFTAFNDSFVRMIEWNREAFEKTLRKTQEEAIGFINRRLERNQRILQSLRDQHELAGTDWFMDAARDYVETSNKIGSCFLEVATSGVQEAADQGKRNTDSFRGASNDISDRTRRAAESAQRRAAE
jgi:hypothetical protein